jgi:DNA/RNA-binding protein KIN17
MRDENGFKMHTQSESHVRQMLLVGEDPKKYINDYSNQFRRDFLLLLRTSHGEKQVQINHFYQEYISNKEHVHMNATKWPSLTEFAKYLGREGICRVEELDKGIHISWIDNSPEALRRQDAIRKKERQDRGDEEREQLLIQEQVERAKRDAEARAGGEDEEIERELKRGEGERVKLSFNTRPVATKSDLQAKVPSQSEPKSSAALVTEARPGMDSVTSDSDGTAAAVAQDTTALAAGISPVEGKPSLKIGFQSKPKNIFAAAKKNALAGKKASVIEQPKRVSEAERIMREEIEQKRSREAYESGCSTQKRPRF